MTNCKLCGKQTKETFCNKECWINWVNSDSFDKEMDDYLGFFTDDWDKLQVKQHKQKIKLYSETCLDLETELIARIRQGKFDKFIQELETNSNEEGDNI
jgi:hypothetical protein